MTSHSILWDVITYPCPRYLRSGAEVLYCQPWWPSTQSIALLVKRTLVTTDIWWRAHKTDGQHHPDFKLCINEIHHSKSIGYDISPSTGSFMNKWPLKNTKTIFSNPQPPTHLNVYLYFGRILDIKYKCILYKIIRADIIHTWYFLIIHINNKKSFNETHVAQITLIHINNNKSDFKHRLTLGCLDQYTWSRLRLWNNQDREAV